MEKGVPVCRCHRSIEGLDRLRDSCESSVALGRHSGNHEPIEGLWRMRVNVGVREGRVRHLTDWKRDALCVHDWSYGAIDQPPFCLIPWWASEWRCRLVTKCRLYQVWSTRSSCPSISCRLPWTPGGVPWLRDNWGWENEVRCRTRSREKRKRKWKVR